MKITRSLVMQYLRGELDEFSARHVREWLEQHPDAPGEWLNEQEWQDKVQHLAPRIPAKKMLFQMRWRMAGVAAAFILLLAGSWYLLEKNGTPGQIKTEMGMVKKLVNHSGKILAYTLPDGSVSELHPGASLEFNEQAYNTEERRLLLKGVARFTVAKDSTRPFRVESGKWTTTALGTIFQVSSGASDSFYIKLEEGRIKIASEADPYHATWYYLKPGDVFRELAGSSGTGIVSTEKVEKEPTAGNGKKEKTAEPKASWTFEHIPLTDLFHHLEQAYGVTIQYNTPLTHSENDFTGTLYRSDPLEMQLSLICNLNGWAWEKTDSTYNIRK